MKLTVTFAVFFSLFIVTNAEAGKGASGAKRVVNLLEAGLIQPYNATPEGVFSCVRAGSGTMPFFQSGIINAEVGVKYVMPLKRDSSCDGQGLNAGAAIIKEENWYTKGEVNAIDIYFEDIASGERIPIAQPEGCLYRNTSSKNLVTSLYLEGVQLVVEVSSAANPIGVMAGWMDNSSVFYAVPAICERTKGTNIR